MTDVNVIPDELSAEGTGVALERLTGQKNYLRWCRAFKLVAQCKGIWDLYTGEEGILDKPLKSDYFQPTVRKRIHGKTDKEPATPTDDNMPASDRSVAIAEYCIDL